MSSERDRIIAHLKGMGDMAFQHKGMMGAIIAQAMHAAAEQIRAGAHADAAEVFPEHMPPKYRITTC